MSRFPIGVMDWPSDFKTYSSKGRGRNAENHYNGVLDWDAMRRFPIMNMMAADSILFAWVTFPTMKTQIDIIESWGYEYITCAFNWVKMNKVQTDKPFVGMGYHTRGNSELCLLFRRGKSLPRQSKAVQQIVWEWVDESVLKKAIQEAFVMWDPEPAYYTPIEAVQVPTQEAWVTEAIATPRQGHSVKPEAVQDRIEQLYAGPYVEFFARRIRQGWTCVGNDIDNQDIFDVLEGWE